MLTSILALLSIPLLSLSDVLSTPTNFFRRYDHQSPMTLQHPSDITSSVSISAEWEVLGPFQIGTRGMREPLPNLGGFSTLKYDPDACFKSSLAPDGLIKWSKIVQNQTASPGTVDISRIDLHVSFPDIPWNDEQAVYGWAGLQYQAWARGHITVTGEKERTVVFYTDSILEFNVGGVHYFGGGFFSYRRAPPVLHLNPGVHTIELRLVRDVRAMGADSQPAIDVVLEAVVEDEAVITLEKHIIAADDVGGRLASPFVSVPLRNNAKHKACLEGLEMHEDSVTVRIMSRTPFCLMPGQTRPLVFHVQYDLENRKQLHLSLKYRIDGAESLSRCLLQYHFRKRLLNETHVYTYLHPSRTVSYAVIRHPDLKSISKSSDKKEELPVLVVLHGAGVEADSDLVRHSLDAVADTRAWTLFPSGGTTWSGDDWHQWGWSDVQAALVAIHDWIKDVNWDGPGADLNRLLVAGHSNGGQGAWYAATHWPDLLIGVAPVSGYLSIQAYVPFQLWHEADPSITAIVQSSLNNYRHELLAPNVHGIPTLQQHGSADDNVPPYHSRRMSFLLNETGWSSDYHELIGKGHWFDGIMTTNPLQRFYKAHLEQSATKVKELPSDFSLVVANPGDSGSKYNATILQLSSPGQLGRLQISTRSNAINILTTNVRRFRLIGHVYKVEDLLVDRQRFSTTIAKGDDTDVIEFLLDEYRVWKLCSPEYGHDHVERHGHQLGSIDAILKTKDSFTIMSKDSQTLDIALQISRNFFQYYAADCEIITYKSSKEATLGNIISLHIGPVTSMSELINHPITLSQESLSIRDHSGAVVEYRSSDYEGLSAIFLSPMSEERLELVIWGHDHRSLGTAARLVPMITGVGQPDFIVLTSECLRKGVGGAVAMGFFDSLWNVTRQSYLS